MQSCLSRRLILRLSIAAQRGPGSAQQWMNQPQARGPSRGSSQAGFSQNRPPQPRPNQNPSLASQSAFVLTTPVADTPIIPTQPSTDPNNATSAYQALSASQYVPHAPPVASQPFNTATPVQPMSVQSVPPPPPPPQQQQPQSEPPPQQQEPRLQQPVLPLQSAVAGSPVPPNAPPSPADARTFATTPSTPSTQPASDQSGLLGFNSNSNRNDANNNRNNNRNDANKNGNDAQSRPNAHNSAAKGAYPSSQSYTINNNYYPSYAASAPYGVPDQYSGYAGQIDPQLVASQLQQQQQPSDGGYGSGPSGGAPYGYGPQYATPQLVPDGGVVADGGGALLGAPDGAVVPGRGAGLGVANGALGQSAGYQQQYNDAAIYNTADSTLATCAAYVWRWFFFGFFFLGFVVYCCVVVLFVGCFCSVLFSYSFFFPFRNLYDYNHNVLSSDTVM
jgi:hypothetical protein